MKKVLIVEDDVTIARIYQGLLRSEKVEVELAQDGEIALECLAKFRPDLILLDLMLPKKNGIQVLKHIRSDPALGQLPVIVFTNGYMGSLMRDALRSGATHCVAKAQSRPKQVVQTVLGYLVAETSLPVEASPTEASGSLAATVAEAVAPAPPAPVEAPTAIASDVLEPLLANASQILSEARRKLLGLAKSDSDEARLSHWAELAVKLGELTKQAREAQLGAIGQMASVLESLAKDGRGRAGANSSDAVRALAQGLDCLDTLLGSAARGKVDPPKSSLVFILDDDAVSRRLISNAIERIGLRCMSQNEPSTVLEVLATNPVDLVFLDVDMPGGNGFQLCKKLREMPATKNLPVIFVTGLTNLESRALSIMSGADDFIRKPFCPAELAARALLHILSPRSRTKPVAPEPARAIQPAVQKVPEPVNRVCKEQPTTVEPSLGRLRMAS